jgi:acetoin utilization protein AcuB
MIVGHYMTHHPVVIGPDEFLSAAKERMRRGNFRRLPVVCEGKLVGIVSERDLRQHLGYLDKTKVNAAMTEELITLSSNDTIEKAAHLMLKRKIGGLPVVEGTDLVGIITYSDILETFLQIMGASEEGTARIDLLIGPGATLSDASKTLESEGAEIISLGTYREKWSRDSVCYLRLRCGDPRHIANVLQIKGYSVVGVYR